LLLACRPIAHAAQKIADDGRANLVPFVRQFLRQATQAACRPQQRLHRIAPRRRLDQALEINHKGAILHGLAPTSRLAGPAGRSRYLAANVGFVRDKSSIAKAR
jgi:hypothetical protein